jgi:hypothetical protein
MASYIFYPVRDIAPINRYSSSPIVSMMASLNAPLTVTGAARISASSIRIWFSRTLISFAATTTTSNYSISGPSSIDISSVDFVPGNNHLDLNIIGTFGNGEYTIIVAINTVKSQAFLSNISQYSAVVEVFGLAAIFGVASRVGSSVIRIDLSYNLRYLAATSDVGRYSISGPSSISISSVAFTPGNNYVLLFIDGTFANGEYFVAILSDTMEAQDYYLFNQALNPSFIIDGIDAITASAAQTDVSEITITFSHSLRVRSETLVSSNYSIYGPSLITVDSVEFTPGNNFVVLNIIGTLAHGEYTITVNSGTVEAQDYYLFNTLLSPTLNIVSLHNPISVFVSRNSLNELKVGFSEAMLDFIATYEPANYTIIGPGNIVVESVSFNPGDNYIILGTIGVYVHGDYSLTIAANTLNPIDGYAQTSDLISSFNIFEILQPSLSNFSPTGAITITTSIGFDVSDPVGTGVQVAVFASFPGLNIYEVIHDGVNWGPNYLPGVVTSLSPGYRYSGIVRRGGWPASPTIVCSAISIEP